MQSWLKSLGVWAPALTAWICFTPQVEAANFGSLFKLMPKTLKVGAVAGGIGIGAGAAVAGVHVAVETGEELKDMDAVLLQLKDQHADDGDNAIFSVLYHLNGDSSAVKWADIVGDPDVFVVVEIEGVGRYVIPEISEEYKGMAVLHTFVAHHALPGQRVAVYVMDDDSLSNEVWNSIARTRVDFRVEGIKKSISRALTVKATATGSIQLIDRPVSIDSHDCIASAVFSVPDYVDGKWWGRVQLLDEKNRDIGELEFKQLGQVPWERYQQILRDRRKTKALLISSSVLAACGLLVFFRFTFVRGKSTTQSV